jgi:hypothetical protein
MPTSFIPRSNPDRARAFGALRAASAPAGVAPEAALAAGEAWQLALAARDAADGAGGEARQQVIGADEAFDRAVRAWARTVATERGAMDGARIKALLGVTPGEWTDEPVATAVQRGARLFERLGGGEPVNDDPTARAALASAHSALAIALAGADAATLRRRAAQDALSAAEDAFDLEYGRVVRRWRAIDEAGLAGALLQF